MNYWGRATLGNTQNEERKAGNCSITPNNGSNVRCSYGNQKVNLTTSPNKWGKERETQRTPLNITQRPKNHYEIKSVAELKASGETSNTLTNSYSNQPVFQTDPKPKLKMDQIGSLLSEFKTKFASIQQKYSLKVKQSETSNASKFQPMTPQTLPSFTRFDSEANRLFLATETYSGNKTPSPTIYQNSTFTTADDRGNFVTSKAKIAYSKQIKLSPQKPSMIEKAIQKKLADKSKFRATFGPIQTKALQIPLRKIREAEEVMVKKTKFANCKDVQSQSESNEEEQEDLKESIVICSYKSNEQKLRRTETIGCNPENRPQESPLDALKRFRSLRLPFQN